MNVIKCKRKIYKYIYVFDKPLKKHFFWYQIQHKSDEITFKNYSKGRRMLTENV